MSMDEGTLLYALETSAFLVPALPGRVERLEVPGVQGRITADSDPFANLVGAATLDEGNADETIWRVREIYADWNKEFGWLVSPLSTPFDLPGRLEGAGLVKAVELAGMVLHRSEPGQSRPTRPSTSTKRPPTTWKPRSTRWPTPWRSPPTAPTR